ncbi:unnamed protein product [Leuciscus chuanchicus]
MAGEDTYCKDREEVESVRRAPRAPNSQDHGWGGGVRGQWVVRSVDSLMKLRGERGLLFPQQERSELGRDSGQVPGGHAEKWVPLIK